MTMAQGWGYTAAHNDTSKLIKIGQMKRMLADCVIRNMSLLLNVGADRHGQIAQAEQNVLRQTGQWLKQVGEAVYETRGGPWNPRDGVYGFAYKGNTIYIYLLNSFNSNEFVVPTLNKNQKVIKTYSVSEGKPIGFKQNGEGETILNKFQKVDNNVTILAIELNKSVYE
jgi:alpha-L-fucosidase